MEEKSVFCSENADIENRLDPVGEGEGGMNGEGNMETYTLLYIK